MTEKRTNDREDAQGGDDIGAHEKKTTAKQARNDSLVSQSWGDFGWRAIPFVGNKHFVDKIRAEMNASARQTFIGERLVGATSDREGWGI